MKIILSGREAELVEILRLAGGYESIAAVVRKLINDYHSDFHDRLSRTGTSQGLQPPRKEPSINKFNQKITNSPPNQPPHDPSNPNGF